MDGSPSYSQRALQRPITYRSPDGRLRQAYPTDLHINEVKLLHNRTRLDQLANKLLKDDTFVLMDTTYVSPIKQARAMRTRASRYGGGNAGNANMNADDELDSSFGGLALAFPSGQRVPDPVNILSKGTKLLVSSVSEEAVSRSSIKNPVIKDNDISLPNRRSISQLRTSSPLALSPRSKIQLAPIGTRHSLAIQSRKPNIDTNISDVSSALVEWRIPTRLYVWGSGAKGQLGVGAFDGRSAVQNTNYPMRVAIGLSSPDKDESEESHGSNPKDFEEVTPINVACGRTVTAIIDNFRRVWVTGDGLLGRGVRERSHIPVMVQGFGGTISVNEVSCGHGFFICSTIEGAVYVWGENLTLQALGSVNKEFRRDGLGVGKMNNTNNLSNSKESNSTGHPLGLPGGELPRVLTPKQIPGFPDPIVSVAAGEGHMVALSSTGIVYTWGAGTSGACGHGNLDHCWLPKPIKLHPKRTRDPTAINYGQMDPGEAMYHQTDYQGGNERRGSFGSMMSSPLSLAGGPSIYNSAQSTVSGTKHKKGSSSTSSPERNSPTGKSGSSSSSSTVVEESRSACAISAGSHHTAVLALDGTVHIFGFAENGRLGLGIDRSMAIAKPTQIRGLPTMVGIACGGAHTVFLSSEGRVYACGDNSFGACGINTRIYRSTGEYKPGMDDDDEEDDLLNKPGRAEAEAKVLVPRQIFSPAFGNVLVTKIYAGARNSAAVSIDGKLWAWGLNTEGGCGTGNDTTTPEPIRVARFRDIRVVHTSLGDAHGASICSRSRITASNAGSIIASLDNEDQGAGEASLSLKLRRARRQQLNVRRKAIAYAASMRRRQARRARRKALRKALTTTMNMDKHRYTSALKAVAEANASIAANDTTALAPRLFRNGSNDDDESLGYQSDNSSMNLNSTHDDNNPTHRRAFARRYASVAAKRRALGAWELDPDDAEYGKNAAAYLIQSMFRRWLYRLKRVQRAHMMNLGLHPTETRNRYQSHASDSGTARPTIRPVTNTSQDYNGNGNLASPSPGTTTRALQLQQLHALGFKPGGKGGASYSCGYM